MDQQTQEKLSALKSQYGKLIVAEVEGKVFGFKPLDRAKVTDLKTQISKRPELAVDLAINACEFCCVFGLSDFKDWSTRFPLAFAGTRGEDGVIDVLMAVARGGAVISVQ